MSNRSSARTWAGRLGRGALVASGAAFAFAAIRAGQRIADVEQLNAEEAAPAGEFANVGGYRLRYLEAGPPDAPALVLIHGFASLAETWQPVMPALARDYHVVAPDLLGFGYSQRLDRPVSNLRHRAALIAGLLDHLGIAGAAVAGNSLGGAVALQCAIDYPERIIRLVLVDPAAGYAGMGGSPAPWLGAVLRHTPLGALLLAATFYNDTWAMRLVGMAYYDPARFTPEMRTLYTGSRRVRGTAASLLALVATPRDDDLPQALPGIQAPTLILWGRHDRIIPPRWAARIHADIPGSRLEWIEDCGHVPQEECPDEVIRHLRPFLKE